MSPNRYLKIGILFFLLLIIAIVLYTQSLFLNSSSQSLSTSAKTYNQTIPGTLNGPCKSTIPRCDPGLHCDFTLTPITCVNSLSPPVSQPTPVTSQPATVAPTNTPGTTSPGKGCEQLPICSDNNLTAGSMLISCTSTCEEIARKDRTINPNNYYIECYDGKQKRCVNSGPKIDYDFFKLNFFRTPVIPLLYTKSASCRDLSPCIMFQSLIEHSSPDYSMNIAEGSWEVINDEGKKTCDLTCGQKAPGSLFACIDFYYDSYDSQIYKTNCYSEIDWKSFYDYNLGYKNEILDGQYCEDLEIILGTTISIKQTFVSNSIEDAYKNCKTLPFCKYRNKQLDFGFKWGCFLPPSPNQPIKSFFDFPRPTDPRR